MGPQTSIPVIFSNDYNLPAITGTNVRVANLTAAADWDAAFNGGTNHGLNDMLNIG
jgi:hypothetical protein